MSDRLRHVWEGAGDIYCAICKQHGWRRRHRMGYGPVVTQGDAEFCPPAAAGCPMPHNEQPGVARGAFEWAVTAVREAIERLVDHDATGTGAHGPGLPNEPSAIELQAQSVKLGLTRTGIDEATARHEKPPEPSAHIGPVI